MDPKGNILCQKLEEIISKYPHLSAALSRTIWDWPPTSQITSIEIENSYRNDDKCILSIHYAKGGASGNEYKVRTFDICDVNQGQTFMNFS